MKRVFEEISDDEWDNHDFKPSRVLKSATTASDDEWDNYDYKPSRVLNSATTSAVPIESFAFNKKQKPSNSSAAASTVDLTVDDTDSEDNCLEDDDVGDYRPPTTRGRRFVIDDDDDDEGAGAGSRNEVVELKSEDDEDDGDWESEGLGTVPSEEEDLVGRALHKCGKISEELRRELYGSSSALPLDSSGYAEVDASSVGIVTQDEVTAACAADDSDFEPLLKPYQLVGVNFLLLLYRKKIGGAILADEMGLGKTVQAITYLTLLNYLENDPGPHLVVCPASVLANWERELKRWCPSFSVIQYHGAARLAYAKELNSLAKAGMPPPFNVMLVCYSLFERRSAQQKDDRKVLKRWRWSCVLMDEAHALKDKNSYRWKNLMSVAKDSNQRLMLTGTPLQNDLHELWSLLEFIMPDLFATENEDLKSLLNAENRELITRMKSILGPFILRRLKSDVMQQLVPKIQKVEYVFMQKEQDDAYKEAIEEYRAFSLSRLSKTSDIDYAAIIKALPRRQISNYFHQFRKIANHPLLIRRIYNDEDVVRFAKKLHPTGVFGFECTMDRVISEMKGYNDFCIHRLLYNYGIKDAKGILPNKKVMESAKCQALANLLPSLKQDGHRVLIFSQWTSMLDILEWTLDVIGVTYQRLDGSTQVSERQVIVDTFNNDTSIFACLLSTRAGGQGLNLTGADTVIIHDMDFNPQIDRQAEDRCHRIGQTKPVTVYRLVTKTTVDENIYEIAKRKLVLDAAVLQNGSVVDDAGDVPERTMGEILSSILLR